MSDYQRLFLKMIGFGDAVLDVHNAQSIRV